jgi:putative SOS response-associated peptidase YedK
MCARYTLIASVSDLQTAFELFDLPERLSPSYNIAPSSWASSIVRERGAGREYRLMRWGLVPTWANDPKAGPINARAETISERPMFKTPFKRRRCLIPATGFFEWREEEGRKQPYYFTRTDGAPFAFGGLWERRDDIDGILDTFTIITTSPNRLVAEYHDRMPVIIPKKSYGTWLDPELQRTDALLPLLEPYPEAEMIAYPVTTRMSNPRFNEPEAVARLSSN